MENWLMLLPEFLLSLSLLLYGRTQESKRKREMSQKKIIIKNCVIRLSLLR